jgi:hypothetical protein
LQYLRHAVDLGFSVGVEMASDDDLKSLQGDPRFRALVQENSRQIAAQKAN